MARGYIRKRGDRSWQLVYDAPRGADGRRQQRFETVQGTKRQAEALLNDRLNTIARGRYFEPTALTVGQYLDQWLRDYAEVNCRPRTVQGYRDIIRIHLVPALGDVQLIRLSGQDIQRYYAEKLRSGLSAQTVRHHHTLLHRALEVAVTWELIERNPSARVPAPAPAPSPGRSLPLEGVRKLLEAVRATEYHLPVHLALYAGLRRSEVLGLWWGDLDLPNRTLEVCRTLMPLRGQGHVWAEPKSRGSNRRIMLPQVTALLLRSHRERLQAEAVDRGMPMLPDQVCAYPDGRLMLPDSLSHAFRRLSRAAGLGVRFHDLRHTHASLMLGEGTPMHVVQARMGHQSIGTTVDIYGHVLADADVVAADKIEQAISGNVAKMWADTASHPECEANS